MAEKSYHDAAASADAAAIRRLTESGANAAELNEYGQTPLHVLAGVYRKGIYDHERIYAAAVALLDAKVSALRKDDYHNQCYHIAAARGVWPLIQALLDRGVRLGITDDKGRTAIHIACEAVENALFTEADAREREERCRMDAEADPSRTSRRERWEEAVADLATAQMRVENYFRIVKALVESGIDAEAKDNNGRTALDYAVEANAKAIGAYLKGDSTAAGGMTLHQACEKNDVEAIEALIAAGGDVDEIGDAAPYIGQTPLAVAIAHMNTEAVDLLLNAGADPNLKTGTMGQVAFLALLNEARVTFQTYEKRLIPHIMNAMHRAGWNIDGTVNDHSDTPLLAASKARSRGRINEFTLEGVISDFLIGLGCNVNSADKDGVTPLMLLLTKDREVENRILSLLENGAQTDSCDKNGNTPLMYAAANTRQATARNYVELLSQFGPVLLQAVNNDGKTAMDVAVDKGNEDVVKYLLDLLT